MNLIKQFAILFFLLFIGDYLSYALHIPIPGNVLGMLFLTLALVFGLIQLKDVEEASSLLLNHLSLFFIPPAVGIMLYFDLIKAQLVSILVPTILSIVIGLYVTGKVVDRLMKEKGDL